jgi:hypothetical protein
MTLQSFAWFLAGLLIGAILVDGLSPHPFSMANETINHLGWVE